MVHRVYRLVAIPQSRSRSGDVYAMMSGRPSLFKRLYYLYLTTFFALYVSIVASRIIRERGLDTIIERETAFGAGGLASLITGRPLILEIIGPRYSRLSVKRSSRVLYYTDSMLHSWVAREKCTKVSSGVNLSLFRSDDRARQEVRERFGLGPEETVVGYVGTFQDWHGIDSLLAAASILLATHPSLKLILVGPFYQRYQSLARQMGVEQVCFFVGPVRYEETPSYINACEIMVAPYDPSKNELRNRYGIGFPLKILEYMACGKPVIATRVPPIDQIISSPDLGLLVEPGDETQLAAAIKELIDHREKAMALGRNGMALAESHYSWSNFARLVSSYVESV